MSDPAVAVQPHFVISAGMAGIQCHGWQNSGGPDAYTLQVYPSPLNRSPRYRSLPGQAYVVGFRLRYAAL